VAPFCEHVEPVPGMSLLGTKRAMADEPSRSALQGKADEVFSGPDSRC
jgi:hypothetical protein